MGTFDILMDVILVRSDFLIIQISHFFHMVKLALLLVNLVENK